MWARGILIIIIDKIKKSDIFIKRKSNVKRIFVYTLLLCSFSVFGQNMQIYPLISGLRELDVPMVSSFEWYALNHSNENYFVDNNGNVTIYTGHRSQIYRYETDDGTLLGTNKGEWEEN